MKVFVTGGGGYLGLAIVGQLVQEGHEVVTYSRGTYPALDRLGAVHHQGSLSDYECLRDAMRGCEAVMHVAAKTGMWGPYQAFYEANVKGTENVLKACRELGIRYLVFTSTPSVIYTDGSEGKNESLPYPKKFEAYYPETKAIAEQAVLNANSDTLTTCALRPHLIWGPADPHFLPVIYERRRQDKLRYLGTTPYMVDVTYVDNAAHAHLLALKVMQANPATVGGKAYFLSQDQPISLQEFTDRLLVAGGLPKVTKTFNPKTARFAGRMFENVYRLFGIKSEPPLTLFLAKQLSSSHWYDISAAKRDLGYAPLVSIDEGMKRLKAWNESNRTNPIH